MPAAEPMRVEMLAIGDELLDGRVTDTNAVRLGLTLSEVGLHLRHRTTVTDDIVAIEAAARDIAARGTGLCVVSGGLGPTADDLTAAAFAALCGVGLERDEAEAKKIVAHLARRGRPLTDNQLKQADRPRGAELLPNPVGTASGFCVIFAGCRFVSVPGVPHEFDTLVEQAIVAPRRARAEPVLRRGLYCFGLTEAEVDRRVQAIVVCWPAVRLQFRVKAPEVHVTLWADPEASAALDAAFDWARTQLGSFVFAERPQSFAEAMVVLLRTHGRTLALAESCTGGLMVDMLTDISGSSEVIHVGVVAYDNAAKVKLLGVDPRSIAAHGAVSEAVVLQMAAGARALVGSAFGLAVSGIAGPGGATSTKPVGTIWFGLAWEGEQVAMRLTLPHDRRGNKLWGAYHALDMLRRHVAGLPPAQQASGPT